MSASTIVRLRPGDPAPATLALVAAVALEEVVRARLPATLAERLWLKWPNDLLLDGGKLSGILLERAEDAVVVGVGVNLAHHPDDTDRPATSFAAHGVAVEPGAFVEALATGFGQWVARWRDAGLGAVRDRWVARAHPAGTSLHVRLPDGTTLDGSFEGLGGDGALILRLADGTARVIHAADVFLV